MFVVGIATKATWLATQEVLAGGGSAKGFS